MTIPHGVMFQSFTWKSADDGTFWDHLADRAEQLRDAGFTAVWLPPACKAQGGPADVGYGVYDLYDLGEFDQKGSVRTRYGDRSQYLACIERLKALGLMTLADIVLNHRMGADETETFLAVEVDPEDRERNLSEPFELEAWTRFNFPGRADLYSDFKWRWQHFNATDQPPGSNDDRPRVFRVHNKNFAHGVGQERGNYDFLMGCNHHLEQPDVRDELMRWSRWMLDTTGVHGFRIDAAKHMSADFLRDFHRQAAEHVGREVYSVGEYAIDAVDAIEGFLDQTDGLLDAFDFPLHFRFHEAGQESGDFDLRTLTHDTLVQRRPSAAVTFVDNHDSDPAQGGDHWVADRFKCSAYAFILLRRDGFPCVYAGDYDGRDGEITDFGDAIRALIRLRQAYNFGDQHDHFDHADRIAWVRTGDADHPGAMVVVIGQSDAAEIDVDTTRSDTRFVRVFGGDEAELTTNEHGHAAFPAPAGGVYVWVTQP